MADPLLVIAVIFAGGCAIAFCVTMGLRDSHRAGAHREGERVRRHRGLAWRLFARRPRLKRLKGPKL